MPGRMIRSAAVVIVVLGWIAARAAAQTTTAPAASTALPPALAEEIARLRSADPNVRGGAAWSLSSRGGQPKILAILPLLSDPDPEVRRAALIAMQPGQIWDEKGWALVQKLVALAGTDPCASVREQALGLLNSVGHLSASILVPVAVKRLSGPAESDKIDAATYIGYATTWTNDTPAALKTALNDPSTEVRRAVSAGWARRDWHAGIELLADARPDVRDAAATQLISALFRIHTDPQIDRKLVALKAHADASVRVLAELACERIGFADRVPLPLAMLDPLLRDKSSSAVRRLAGRSIMSPQDGDGGARQLHGTAKALSAAADPNIDIATDAIRSLSEMHGIDSDVNRKHIPPVPACKPIGKGLEAPASGDRIAALDGLAKLPTENATAPYMWNFAMRLLDDPDPKVRAAAVAALRTVLQANFKSYVALTARIPPPLPTPATTRAAATAAPAATIPAMRP